VFRWGGCPTRKSEDGFDEVGIAFIDLTGETTSEEADSDSDVEIQKFEL
jgi:hypothetical protein